jgi:hypothetical protein
MRIKQFYYQFLSTCKERMTFEDWKLFLDDKGTHLEDKFGNKILYSEV